MTENLSPLPSAKDVLNLSEGNLTRAPKASTKDIDKTANEFESMFLAQMLAPMWTGLDSENSFTGGSAEETYRSMMISEYGKIITKSGGLGIADMVRGELLRAQEERQNRKSIPSTTSPTL